MNQRKQKVFFDGEMREISFVFRIMKEAGIPEPQILRDFELKLGVGEFTEVR